MGSHAGVVFDLDETLVNRRDSLTRYAMSLWAAQRGRQPLDQPAFVTRFHALDNGGRTPRKVFFERFTSELLPHVTAADFENHFYDGAWAEPILFDDVVSVLGELRLRDYRIGIISNGGQRAQSAKILNSPLRDLVDDFLISESFGATKPDAAIFKAMAERLDLDVARTWFVGDDPVADIVGGLRAGFKAVWVERHTSWPEAEPAVYTARITALGDLRSVMGLA
ncbi:HAD family hydrolase [Uliginosibacterium sp. H3]|uniref:HAD family hydrolase n=1 Tax=Uliginosibacterium silvisoli TaxID=3114758 RepID=A0ABU6K842_9RHOO|nr:HAD family hydrolase [Uliginosibacterium sp. H3]